MNDDHRKWLEGVGFALIAIGLLLTFTLDPDSVLWQGIQATAWFAIALGNSRKSPYARAMRKVGFGIAVLIALAIAGQLLSIESPFSERTTGRIEAIAALALLALVPAYVIRALLQPTSADYRMIEAAHKAGQRRTREQAKDRPA